MAYKPAYNKRRTYKRKTYKKKPYSKELSKLSYYKRKYGPDTIVLEGANNSIMPKQCIKKIRFCTKFTLDPTIGGVSSHLFQLNGLYDFDLTTGGANQGITFDNMMTFYQYYGVLNGKLTAYFDNEVGTASVFAGIQLHENQSYTPSDLQTILERGDCTYKHVSQHEGSRSTVKCSKTFSMNKWYGRSYKPIEDTFRGTDAANPTEGLFASVFVAADNASQDPSPITVVVVAEITAMFYGLKQINLS